MPFGAVYGALFFVTAGFWLIFTAAAPVPMTGIARFGLAAACLAVGAGLPLKRAWARWMGVLVAGFFVVFQISSEHLGQGVAANLILFGAMVGLLLLLAPGTGSFRRGPEGSRPAAPRLGRVLAAAASVGLVCVAVGLWLGAQAPTSANSATAPGAGQATFLSDRVTWSSFGRGLQQAQAEGKPLLVNFEADWCPYCIKMGRTTWRDADVVRRTADLVPVRVDGEEGLDRDGYVGRDLARNFGVQGFPMLILLDPEGREIARTGGYQDAGQLLSWLDRTLPPTGDRAGEI